MYLNILDQNQSDLLPLVAGFKKEFYMVGGTAIALHIGHRRSIDFDLFRKGIIKPKAIIKKFEDKKEKIIVTLNIDGQLNLVCREVKFTFFEYEFEIPHDITIERFITIPNLLDLSAMKAYALGRRSKWKDYVDLYFILKDHYTVEIISQRAKELYKDLFSEKLFRGQLNYFVGINYDEQMEYMPGFSVPDEEIKAFLTDAALTGF
jgi:Nucleotidyl transferase AbiEii toxin, Type IV TA system